MFTFPPPAESLPPADLDDGTRRGKSAFRLICKGLIPPVAIAMVLERPLFPGVAKFVRDSCVGENNGPEGVSFSDDRLLLLESGVWVEECALAFVDAGNGE